MSIWSDNPEWFDEWLEQKALNGDLGAEVQALAEHGDFVGWEQWPKYLELGHQAEQAFVERLIP